MSYLSRRLFSTVQSHAPPKKIFGLIGRYAGATYTAASKAKLLDTVEGEMLAFKEICGKSPNFVAFLQNPTIARKEKYEKINDLLDNKFSDITRNLFLVMTANGRVGDALKVVGAYEELMQASRGAVKVTIISAEPLKKKQLETIESGVVAMVGQGSTVDVTAQVDPTILGGLQVLVGDKFLDLSVSSRVASLTSTLTSIN